jgi:ribosomal protein S18 acetylase RimI-like enzyme
MEIYILQSSDWDKYKKIRLDALKNDALAFGDSFAQSLNLADDEWKSEFEDNKSFIMVANENDEIFAMVGAYQEDGEKMHHVAYIWGVYVKKEYRGRGLGEKVMRAVLDTLATNTEIIKVDLNVNTAQISAVKLYQKLGFTIAGTLHQELKVQNSYYDEYVMEKFL